MYDKDSIYDKQITNSAESLDALSALAPDTDPALLLATAEAMTKLSDAIRDMQDLGLVESAAGRIVLTNGTMINFRQQ